VGWKGLLLRLEAGQLALLGRRERGPDHLIAGRERRGRGGQGRRGKRGEEEGHRRLGEEHRVEEAARSGIGLAC